MKNLNFFDDEKIISLILFDNDINDKIFIKNCKNLEECNFNILKKLKLTNCENLKKINLKNLEKLQINKCNNIKEIIFNKINSLILYNLKFFSCDKILNYIQYLELQNCKFNLIIDSIPLKILIIKNCKNIKFNLNTLSNLKELTIVNNENIYEINNKNLNFCFIEKCKNIRKIETKKECFNYIFYCDSLVSISYSRNNIAKCYWLNSNKKINLIKKIQKNFRNKKLNKIKKNIFFTKCLENNKNLFEPELFKIMNSFI